MNLRFIGVAAAFVAGGFASAAEAAKAIDGLAAMHDLRRERGGVVCFSDHFHYGTSAGVSSKRGAEIEAIRSWADFVSFEYGSAWMNYRKAGSKAMSCTQSGGGWGCEVSARPCQ